MTHSNEQLENLNTAFDTYKEKFSGSFHTTLWRVCADNITNGKIACFVSNYTEHGLRLGIAYANESGYSPCPAYFKEGIKYDDACKILDGLNQIIFGITDDEAMRITISSMRKPAIAS